MHLWLYGANMDVLPPDARESLVQAMQTAAEDGNVTLAGAYDHAAVPRLMAEVDWVVVPSRWWENSPLVIQEAFMHGRPVICTDIGGMKEKVTHDVNGLHFVVAQPAEPGRHDLEGREHARPVGAAAGRDPGHLLDGASTWPTWRRSTTS